MVALLIASLIAGVAIWFYLRSTHNAATPPLSPSDSAIAASTPDGGTWTGGDGAVYQKLGGINFVTKPSAAMQAAAEAGATAYDPSNPAVVQRRLDALAGVQQGQIYLGQEAAKTGQTIDQVVQGHLAQDLAAQQAETQAIMNAAARANAAAGAAAAAAAANAASAAVNQANSPQASNPAPTISVTRRGVGHFNGVSATPTGTAAALPGPNADYANAILSAGPTTPAPGPGYTWNYYTQQWQASLN